MTAHKAIIIALALIAFAAFDASGSEKRIIEDTNRSVEVETSQEITAPVYEYKHLQEQSSDKASAIDEQIRWQVFSGGGVVNGTSTNYVHFGTISQTAAGIGGANNLVLNHGFWQDFPDNVGCCDTPGDANDDGYTNEMPSSSSLTFSAEVLAPIVPKKAMPTPIVRSTSVTPFF